MTTATDRQALVAKWRAEAERFRAQADEVRRRGTGSRHATAALWSFGANASTLETCAKELEALSSSGSSETPQHVTRD